MILKNGQVTITDEDVRVEGFLTTYDPEELHEYRRAALLWARAKIEDALAAEVHVVEERVRLTVLRDLLGIRKGKPVWTPAE